MSESKAKGEQGILNSTEAPMEGITNVAKTVSANPNEEVWLGLIFYRDR
jgi:hypothetical protein